MASTIFALSGCGAGHAPQLAVPTPSGAVPTAPIDAAGQLAGLAAAAHDRRYVAAYTLTRKGKSARTVIASLATDGTWQVDVEGGALSGGGNVAIVGLASGTYQCLVSGSATTAATPTRTPTTTPSASGSASASPSASASAPSTRRFAAPACVKVAGAGKPVPDKYDPIFEHLFTDWLGVMLDRDAPISVFAASPLPHVTDACYSVESSSASLAPLIDSGIFCFAPDGTLTAAKIDAGTLTMTGTPAPAPPTTTLPAAVIDGPAAPTKAPSAP